MEWFIKISSSIRHGKILALVKPFLNVLFIASITFYCYSWVYGKPNLPSTFELKALLEYFLKGEFIIPFSLFFIFWGFTAYAFSQFFDLINLWITNKISEILLNSRFIQNYGNYKELDDAIDILKITRAAPASWTLRIFEAVKKGIPEEEVKNIEKRLRQAKLDYTTDFTLIFRSLIATSIYFSNVSAFGYKLFLSLVIIHLAMGFLIILGYQVAALLPIIAVKFQKEYDQYKRQESLLIK